MALEFDPAALGGLAGFIAVVAWSIGRLQGSSQSAGAAAILPARVKSGPRAAGLPPSPAHAEACGSAATRDAAAEMRRQQALSERRDLLSRPVVLSELAAAVSAIRRDERIFASHPEEEALLEASSAPCRYVGSLGGPASPALCAAAGSAVQSAAMPAPVMPMRAEAFAEGEGGGSAF